MSRDREGALDVFVSYAHEDEALCDELRKQLTVLEREGKIRSWHDRRIAPGEEWGGEIDYRLNAADVILLLISPDFMASKYCYEVELPRSMARHRSGGARVVPIILRPADWGLAPFADLESLPKDARPVTSWPDRDDAFLNIQQGLRRVIEEESRRRRLAPKIFGPSDDAREVRSRSRDDDLAASAVENADSARPGSGAYAWVTNHRWQVLHVTFAVLSVLGVSWALREEPLDRTVSPRSGLITLLATPKNYVTGKQLQIQETIEVYDDRFDGSLSEVPQAEDRIVGQWQAGTLIECNQQEVAPVDGGGWLRCRRIQR